jgi:hypothetical protein
LGLDRVEFYSIKGFYENGKEIDQVLLNELKKIAEKEMESEGEGRVGYFEGNGRVISMMKFKNNEYLSNRILRECLKRVY